jgi:hypothetical protein
VSARAPGVTPRPTAGRGVRTLGALAAVGVCGLAGYHLVGHTTGTVERTERISAAPGTDRLTLATGAGEVRVLGGEGPAAVDAVRRGAVFMPGVTVTRRNGATTLDGGCPWFAVGSCEVHLTARVPAGVVVDASTGSGEMYVSGSLGSLGLRSSSGDIEADRAAGSQISLESSSGDIEGRDLDYVSVRADTSSGDIDLDLAGAPRTVRAGASSGDVTVLLPRGDALYRVEIDVSSGSQDVQVRTDPSSPRLIRVSAGSGDVRVGYRD